MSKNKILKSTELSQIKEEIKKETDKIPQQKKMMSIEDYTTQTKQNIILDYEQVKTNILRTIDIYANKLLEAELVIRAQKEELDKLRNK